MLVQVEGKASHQVVDALVRQVRQLPQGVMSSLTWDRGTELAMHKRFTIATDVASISATRKVLGSAAATKTPTACCANTSRKKSSLSGYSHKDLDAVAMKLNTRPRKTLGYKTPSDTLKALLL
jgi:IS30 family transposase